MPSNPYRGLSEVQFAGKDEILSFLTGISIQKPEAEKIISQEKKGIVILIKLLEGRYSHSFTLAVSCFLEDAFDGLLTKRRFNEISKNFSLWAAYQEHETKKDAEEEELLFELPINEMIAGKTSEEGRFINYLVKTKIKSAEELKKAKKGTTIIMLLTGNELHISKLIFNHFRFSNDIYPVKWNICLYLVHQISDEEISEFMACLPLGKEEKNMIIAQLSASLTYVKLLREIWALGKMVQMIDLIKNIGSKGISDENSVRTFCNENELTELFEEVSKEAKEMTEAIANCSFLSKEQRSLTETYSEEMRKLLETKSSSEEERLKRYEKAHKFASSFYDNAVYELGIERTIARYGERKNFMEEGLRVYIG